MLDFHLHFQIIMSRATNLLILHEVYYFYYFSFCSRINYLSRGNWVEVLKWNAFLIANVFQIDSTLGRSHFYFPTTDNNDNCYTYMKNNKYSECHQTTIFFFIISFLFWYSNSYRKLPHISYLTSKVLASPTVRLFLFSVYLFLFLFYQKLLRKSTVYKYIYV